MKHDIYSALLKALVMNNTSDVSCHPVRVSAAGAIAKLLDVGSVKSTVLMVEIATAANFSTFFDLF